MSVWFTVGAVAALLQATPPSPTAPAPTELETLRARIEALETTVATQQAEQMAAAEAAAITGPEADEQRLQIYGFMDAGFNKSFVSGTQPGLWPTTATTFVSGNTNIYFDARPAPRWRGLVEARLTLNPHGLWTFSSAGVGTRTDNRIFDFTSPSARETVTWGGVILERAQIEWTRSDLLTIVTGMFLTPWGIWNVDHGTPTTIGLFLPTFLVQEAVPKQQTGVQAFGSWHAPPWELGYRAFVSNGRTATQFDLSEDKAVGGRLFLRRVGTATTTFGASGYLGTSQDDRRSVALSGETRLVATKRTIHDYAEQIVGLDLAVDWAGVRLRSEAVQRHVRHEDGLHEVHPSLPGAFYPNRFEKYLYALAAYRLGAVEPYVYFETGDRGLRTNYLPDKGTALSGGLNIYLSSATQLKVQYVGGRFENITGTNNFHLLFGRLVLAF